MKMSKFSHTPATERVPPRLSLCVSFLDIQWNIQLSDANPWSNIHITYITHICHGHSYTHTHTRQMGRRRPFFVIHHWEMAVIKHMGVFVSYEWEICLRSRIAQSRCLLVTKYTYFVNNLKRATCCVWERAFPHSKSAGRARQAVQRWGFKRASILQLNGVWWILLGPQSTMSRAVKPHGAKITTIRDGREWNRADWSLLVVGHTKKRPMALQSLFKKKKKIHLKIIKFDWFVKGCEKQVIWSEWQCFLDAQQRPSSCRA